MGGRSAECHIGDRACGRSGGAGCIRPHARGSRSETCPGRPAGSGSKEQVAIRLDKEILAAFRSTDAGWQTRMNDAIKDWLKTHNPT
ncbi:MAG: BrnA antitoxin family protein [Gallionellaceae bacterium]|nr:BrnA antitoxin family protein [Gallionellaceae bacterium]